MTRHGPTTPTAHVTRHAPPTVGNPRPKRPLRSHPEKPVANPKNIADHHTRLNLRPWKRPRPTRRQITAANPAPRHRPLGNARRRLKWSPRRGRSRQACAPGASDKNLASLVRNASRQVLASHFPVAPFSVLNLRIADAPLLPRTVLTVVWLRQSACGMCRAGTQYGNNRQPTSPINRSIGSRRC